MPNRKIALGNFITILHGFIIQSLLYFIKMPNCNITLNNFIDVSRDRDKLWFRPCELDPTVWIVPECVKILFIKIVDNRCCGNIKIGPAACLVDCVWRLATVDTDLSKKFCLCSVKLFKFPNVREVHRSKQRM